MEAAPHGQDAAEGDDHPEDDGGAQGGTGDGVLAVGDLLAEDRRQGEEDHAEQEEEHRRRAEAAEGVADAVEEVVGDGEALALLDG